MMELSERDKDRVRLKRIVFSTNLDENVIKDALNEFFMKYCVTDKVAVKKTAATNILEIFDGGLF